jgi:hypothetical protein
VIATTPVADLQAAPLVVRKLVEWFETTQRSEQIRAAVADVRGRFLIDSTPANSALR